MKTEHHCEETDYRCQYEDKDGNLCCCYNGVLVLADEIILCSICGGVFPIIKHLPDGRQVRTYGDAEWPVGHHFNPGGV